MEGRYLPPPRTKNSTNVISFFNPSLITQLLIIFLTYLGISDVERARRKEKNIVSTKINFILWLTEVFSYISF